MASVARCHVACDIILGTGQVSRRDLQRMIASIRRYRVCQEIRAVLSARQVLSLQRGRRPEDATWHSSRLSPIRRSGCSRRRSGDSSSYPVTSPTMWKRTMPAPPAETRPLPAATVAALFLRTCQEPAAGVAFAPKRSARRRVATPSRQKLARRSLFALECRSIATWTAIDRERRKEWTRGKLVRLVRQSGRGRGARVAGGQLTAIAAAKMEDSGPFDSRGNDEESDPNLLSGFGIWTKSRTGSSGGRMRREWEEEERRMAAADSPATTRLSANRMGSLIGVDGDRMADTSTNPRGPLIDLDADRMLIVAEGVCVLIGLGGCLSLAWRARISAAHSSSSSSSSLSSSSSRSFSSSPTSIAQVSGPVSSGPPAAGPSRSQPLATWHVLMPLCLALLINLLSRVGGIWIRPGKRGRGGGGGGGEGGGVLSFLGRPVGSKNGGGMKAAAGWEASAPVGGDLLTRVTRVEDDLQSMVKMTRMLSRQLEKLGVRFRVTRRTLRDPMMETSDRSLRNAALITILSSRADRMEREMGETQQLLLAMQEQAARQLDVLASATSKTLQNQRAIQERLTAVEIRERRRESVQEPSDGEGEKGVISRGEEDEGRLDGGGVDGEERREDVGVDDGLGRERAVAGLSQEKEGSGNVVAIPTGGESALIVDGVDFEKSGDGRWRGGDM